MPRARGNGGQETQKPPPGRAGASRIYSQVASVAAVEYADAGDVFQTGLVTAAAGRSAGGLAAAARFATAATAAALAATALAAALLFALGTTAAVIVATARRLAATARGGATGGLHAASGGGSRT